MNIKSLLLGSAAALVAVSGARAADAVVVAEPEPVEYVRVCDTYGAGFFYIPGSETCLKISGYVRSNIKSGKDVYTGEDKKTYRWDSRVTTRFDARSETELGTLRSFAELRYNFKNGADADKVDLNAGYIELGGFRVGTTDSQFTSWTDYLGKVMNDDVVAEGPYNTNQISYTFAGSNGFSATIGLEQGAGDYTSGYKSVEDDDGEITLKEVKSPYKINDYMPHVVAGVKVTQSWGGISAVAAYDSVVEEFAGKVRLDVKANDQISFFVMGGYQSGWGETHTKNGVKLSKQNYYGSWSGDYAVWGGATFKVNDQAKVNAQVGYEDEGTIAAAVNVAYEIVPGFVVTPEINYTSLDGDRAKAAKAEGYDTDVWGGMIRFQRNF